MHTPIVPSIAETGAPDTVVRSAPELTIVIPTFKERHNVAQIVARLRGLLADYDWEVIFADDDSPDGTAMLVRSIGEHE